MLKLAAASVALVALASAAPAAPEPQGSVIERIATGNKKFKNGAQSVMRTYQKFNAAVPEHIASAAAAAQQGTVTATPDQYDSEYTAPVLIGTPGKTLNLDFDTGSSDLWVFSSRLPSSSQSGHNIYNPSSSSSSRLDSGETWDISYGDGSGASGVVYFDKVVIGGVTVTSQAVEAATSISSAFQQGDNDGLVGLAFDSLNTGSPTRLQTFMGNAGPSLTQNLFAAWLKYEQPGAYDIGFTNTAHYSGSITYTSVSTSQGFWQFNTGGYYVGNTQYSTGYSVIADTGTTLVYLPNTVVSNYYRQVSGAQNSNAAGGYIFPCGTILPSLSIVISGIKRTIPGQYLNYAPYSGNQCFGGLQSSSGIGINILGDVFLKSQYVVFNLGTTQIGFATAK